jgi:hypothetical protein
MAIFRIPNSTPGAASTTVHAAETARELGYTNVQTGYEPPTKTHVVTGTPPAVPNTPPAGR